MNKKEELAILKVGDTVIVSNRHWTQVRTVERITPTQIVVNGTKYRKENGAKIGNTDRWSLERVSIPKEGEIQAIADERVKNKLISEMRDAKFHLLTLDQLRRISAIINEPKL